MAGVAILFRYGFPQPTHDESTCLSIPGPEADKNANAVRAIKRKYICRSRTAMGLIVVGFIFQLCATWL